MKRDQFQKLCRDTLKGNDFSFSQAVLPEVKKYLKKENKEKLPVIWLETNDSGDNNIAFMNTTYPYLDRVFEDIIDLWYSNTFMAAQGINALDILEKTAEKYAHEYTLVVEGAVPLKYNGLFNVLGYSKDYIIAAKNAVRWFGKHAKYVVAIGTCASFGGPTAARPNITGSVSVSEILDRAVINVSGCPVNPEWFVGTLAHLLMYGMPELDNLGRPALFYGFTVHRHCQRRSYFDNNNFAQEIGDSECMFSLGCSGPRTGADCPYRMWINHVSWPVKVNTPCIGCTNKDFPDGSSPFFTPLPKKSGSKKEDSGKEQDS